MYVCLLASSLEYPQRIEWSQSLNRLIVYSLRVSKFSHFSLFHPPLFIQYSTEECSTVQLLARSPEYPQVQRIRVASVVEFCACLIVPCVSANFLIFPSFILLFLYSTVQKSAVQYSYWPATIPGHVTTGKKVASVFELLENSLLVCLLVSKFSNFSSPHLLFYSCLLCYWPAPSSIHRGLEWPQCLNSVSVCLLDCSLSGSKFSNFFLF